MPMPVVQQFAFGPVNPIVAYFCSFIGALLGLLCTARARQTVNRRRRARWLILAAVAIGGPGIWLMHFMAMLGFDVPATTIRYNLGLTALSLLTSIVVVAIGLFIAGFATPSASRTVLGGLVTGGGVAAMHYIGMDAMTFDGTISYAPNLVAASILIAVAASTVALWFTVSVRGTWPIIGAAAVMGVAVSGMHYTGMAAMRVRLDTTAGPVRGVSPLLLLVPITVLTIAALFGLVLSSMTMTPDEEAQNGAERAAVNLGVAPLAAVPVDTPLAMFAASPPHAAARPAQPAAGVPRDRRLRSHRQH